MRILLIMALLCPFLCMCQPLSLRGKIMDETGQPVSGATITVHPATPNTGHQTANASSLFRTTSNSVGEFTIPSLRLGDTLFVTAVGYATETEIIDRSVRNPLTIVLHQKVGVLDEALIIAYGSTTRRLSTGSISRVTAAEMARQPVLNPLSALQDRVPGLVITQSAGLPGAAVSVQLRGRSSIAQGSSPLFIIDGVPFAAGNESINNLSSSLTVSNEAGGLSPFSTVNPADIESIEVLKDADATAIYGSRGAGGVILITTKKGKAGKTVVTANVWAGFSRATRLMKLMNTAQYLEMRREAFKNDGVTPTAANAYDLLLFDTARYTDFTKLFYGGTAGTLSANISLSGGTPLTRFSLGGGYSRETAVFPGSLPSHRASAHIRLDHQSPGGAVTVGLTASYSAATTRLVSNNFAQALLLPPNYPAFFEADGSLAWTYRGISLINPYAYLLQKYEAQTANLVSNLQLSVRLARGLAFRLSLGANRLASVEESKNPKASFNPASGVVANASFGNASYQTLIAEPQLTYTTSLAGGQLTALLGGTAQSGTDRSFYITGSGYANDALLGSIEAAGTVTARRNSVRQYRYAAVFSRLSYNWRGKYLLNGSARSDGSSRFGPGRRWGTFGAVGGGWIFTEERWAKKLSGLSFGKLRGSWGTAGNDKVGDYQYLNTWSATSAYAGSSGLAPTALFNPGYSWETAHKLEAAVELGFINNRYRLTLIAYRSRTSGQLIQYKLPIQTGFPSVMQNFPATVQNSGWEAEFIAQPLKGKLQWTATALLTVPRNRLLSFPGIESSSYSSLVVGQPLSVYGGYRYLGVDPATGIYRLADRHGAVITTAVSADRVRNLGNTEPLFYGSLSNTLSWKGWELSFLFGFKKGPGLNYLAQLAGKYPGTINNLPVEVLDRWQRPGDEATFQKYTQSLGPAGLAAALFAQNNTDGKYTDASYIRLRNLALSWSFPATWMQRVKASGARLYLQCQNLFTITGYRGADPENQNFLTLPPLRTVTAGFQFTF